MVRQAFMKEIDTVAELALLLWPHHSSTELRSGIEQLIASGDALFLLDFEQEIPVGFAYCQLRNDYVEGTQGGPVGYLEGIFVREKFRKTGIASRLLTECEAWARKKNCKEFASDCELDNTVSFEFHKKVGFNEANRIICFTKKL